MTLSSPILETVEINSSVMPSAKYLSFGSALRFANGRIAIRRGSRMGSSDSVSPLGTSTAYSLNGNVLFPGAVNALEFLSYYERQDWAETDNFVPVRIEEVTPA